MVWFFFKQKTAYEISACLVGSEMCIRDRYDDDNNDDYDDDADTENKCCSRNKKKTETLYVLYFISTLCNYVLKMSVFCC